jgi:DNA invertase Pin-like site-specific DNA recombinase
MHETNPEKRPIGYARVSTYGQTLDSQLAELSKAGCTSRNIYREKVTGARADRRELNRMLRKLAPGDVVTVMRIDRLARSTFDLFGIVKRIVDAKAQFRSLAEPWADTGTSTGRLMLAVLGDLADVERDLIRTRTAEGRSRAKAQGKHMGRPPSLTPTQKKDAIRRRSQGATLDELARSYNVSRAIPRRVPATPVPVPVDNFYEWAKVAVSRQLQWPRSPRSHPKKPRFSNAVSSRSVFARRCLFGNRGDARYANHWRMSSYVQHTERSLPERACGGRRIRSTGGGPPSGS